MLAICIKCNKEWQNWGSYDNFCGYKCEEEYKYNLQSIVKSIVVSMTLHQAKTLYDLIGDEYLFFEVFREELENKL